MSGVSYLDFLGIGTSDQHKPTYTQLRDEGLSNAAIETLLLTRDLLTIRTADIERGKATRWDVARDLADWLRISVGHYPLEVEDVYPDGAPCRCETFGLAACLVHADFDPTDQQLAGIGWAHGSRGLS